MKTDAFKKNFFTGFVALLPIALLLLVLTWLYRIVVSFVAPVGAVTGTPIWLTIIISLVGVALIVFLVGVAVRTKLGSWFFKQTERYILAYIPGYNAIKNLIEPFVGGAFKESLQSAVVVDIFGTGTLMMGFITNTTPEKNLTTVFIPTGPNPASGNIYHVPNKRVFPVNTRVDTMLKTVVSVGNNSNKILTKMQK
ncbi:DUF502 domain-containing protein [Candidatus Woesearchaeota archaeon]|nr:DUF502 domain-containing protein [Candidatus Woesearchaeota archaeon]